MNIASVQISQQFIHKTSNIISLKFVLPQERNAQGCTVQRSAVQPDAARSSGEPFTISNSELSSAMELGRDSAARPATQPTGKPRGLDEKLKGFRVVQNNSSPEMR